MIQVRLPDHHLLQAHHYLQIHLLLLLLLAAEVLEKMKAWQQVEKEIELAQEGVLLQMLELEQTICQSWWGLL